jgi:hypothetical protein
LAKAGDWDLRDRVVRVRLRFVAGAILLLFELSGFPLLLECGLMPEVGTIFVLAGPFCGGVAFAFAGCRVFLHRT